MNRLAWLPILVLLFATACGLREGAAPQTSGMASPAGEAASRDKAAPDQDQQQPPSANAVVRKIIRDAALEIEVQDVQKALAECRRLGLSAGGYVANSSVAASDAEPRQATLVLKIPAFRLDDVLKELSGLGRVRSLSESARDVTEEFYDLEARVRTLKHEEERLLALLQRAGNVKDLLEVERELARVRGEAESMQGRLRVLSHQVDLSTVQVTLRAPQTLTAPNWYDSLGEDVQSAVDLFFGLAHFGFRVMLYGLVLVPFVAPFWLGLRALRRR